MQHKHKILFVEDEQDIRMLYETLLSNKKYSLTCMEVIGQAFEWAEKNRPDLILLDLILQEKKGESPLFDKYLGLELLKKIKTSEKTKKIPVVVFSNLKEKNVINQAMALGAADFIVKSQVKPRDMVEKIETLLK